MFIDISDDLYEEILQLIKDKGAKNKHKVSFDIDSLIASTATNKYVEYWGETVTIKRNWQSNPEHPKTFLAYITVAEAKLLRSLGLGYSFKNSNFEQHFDNNNIPSFNGYGVGDSDSNGMSSGDGNSEGESEASGGFNDSSDDGWTTENFTNPDTGQTGTVSFNQDGNYNVSYDDGTGFGFSDGLNDGAGGNYSYGDDDSDGVADASYNFGDTSIFNGLFGEELATQEYLSAVGKFDGGTLSSFTNGDLSYTESFYSIDGYEIGLGKEEFRWLSPTSWLDSIIADVTINGYDVGILGDIGFGLGGLIDDESALIGGIVGGVLGITVAGYVNYTMINAGNYMIGAGKVLGNSKITVAGYTTLVSAFVGIYNNLQELNTLFGGYTTGISMMDNISGGNSGKKFNIAFEKAVAQYEADNYQRQMYASSVLDGTVYDKMAGGIIYNDVMSGGNLWGATKSANTSFSVGVPFKLGKNVVRTNYPYSKYAGSYNKNLAGDSTFSVLKFKG